MGRALRRLGIGLLLAQAVACKARESSTHPTQSQLDDERGRVERGEDVGASWRAPSIELDEVKLSVNHETLASTPALPRGPHVIVTPLLAHLQALREHWQKIHVASVFFSAPVVTIAPGVSAELELDVLSTLAAAGFLQVKVSSGLDAFEVALGAPGADAFQVTTFVEDEHGTYDVTLLTGQDCSVIFDHEARVDPAKLPVVFMISGSVIDAGREELMVTPRPGSTAGQVTATLSKVLDSPLIRAVDPKLRFEWSPRYCPSDGKWGHAN